MKTSWNGQRIVHTININTRHSEDYVACAKCGGHIGLASSAWFDKDNLYKHFHCLSKQRILEIKHNI
jgi:hypothetical protein